MSVGHLDPQVVAPTFENSEGLSPIWRGHLYTTTPEAISIFDEKITTGHTLLRGGWYELLVPGEAVLGDYLELAIVDKDDVLGYFGAYGLTVGQDVLELKKYVHNEYMCPSVAGVRREFGANGVFQVMAGLYIRTLYTSVGTVPVHLKTVVLTYA